jgi:hypothetical protein
VDFLRLEYLENIMKKLVILLVLLAMLILRAPRCVYASDLSGAIKATIVFRQLDKSYPKQFEVKKKEKLIIEFCPDNTCDMFEANKQILPETFVDFVYIYLYFFSDYYVLDEWRTSAEEILMVGNILKRPSYSLCKKSTPGETASCLLRYLSQKNKIRLYSIRYDEGTRNVVRLDVQKETKIAIKQSNSKCE